MRLIVTALALSFALMPLQAAKRPARPHVAKAKKSKFKGHKAAKHPKVNHKTN